MRGMLFEPPCHLIRQLFVLGEVPISRIRTLHLEEPGELPSRLPLSPRRR